MNSLQIQYKYSTSHTSAAQRLYIKLVQNADANPHKIAPKVNIIEYDESDACAEDDWLDAKEVVEAQG